MAAIAKEDGGMWEKLYKAWLEQGKPGWVLLGGSQYRVLHPNDDDVKFEPRSGFDSYYGSQSKGLSND